MNSAYRTSCLVCLASVVVAAIGCQEQKQSVIREETIAMQAPVAAQPAAASKDDRLSRLDFRQVVAHAKDKVFPSVVYIKVLKESHESGKKITQEVSGSGVIISSSGELLTNWHVVDKAAEVRCLLFDGKAYDATVVGSDKDTDLALVQLKLPDAQTSGVPIAELGDSSLLKEGDFVMAMGAPWGLSRSVSIGIISCTKRFLPDRGEYSLWLQTDASISPGNSGGPLVNTQGQVIGINTLGSSSGGDMGFAIPSATIKVVVAQLREHGRMNWSWTGLQLQPLRDFQRNVYFDGDDGVIVSETDPESPARLAGIRSRDRILAINGRKIAAMTEEDLPAIRSMLGLLEKEKPVQLLVRRESKEVTIMATPREKGKVEGDELDCPRWDITVKTINQFDNEDLFFYRKAGVFVYGVKYPGNASSAGLQEQDIIIQVDGKEVTKLDDIKDVHKKTVDDVQNNPRISFTVLRNGLVCQIVVDISRDYEKE